MNSNKAFQQFIETVSPKICYDENYKTFYKYNDGILSYDIIKQEEDGLKIEMGKLEADLFHIQEGDRFLYSSIILGDLINTYFDIRFDMENYDEGSEEIKIRRYLMLTVYNAMAMVIFVIDRLKIPFPRNYITDCERKGLKGISELMSAFNGINIVKIEMDSGEPTHEEGYDNPKKEMSLSPNKSAIDGKYNYNRGNPNYMEEYLDELYNVLSLATQKKIFFGAVCAVLHGRKIFTNYGTFKDLMKTLASYWGIELPKEMSPNKYEKTAQSLIRSYCILEKNIS